jgi:hypothetical protein
MRGWRQTGLATLLAAVAVLAGGCGSAPASLAELNASYERALERTAPLAATLVPGSDLERRAFGNVQRYFAGMTPASVREQTAAVYAPQGYLNDTLVGIEGADRIAAYFGHTAERARVLRVDFLERAPVGTDWYVRWRMTVAVDGLNGGQEVITYGVTQFRFDNEGRVLIHKDFWDSGTGLYEHIPVLGSALRRVRGAVEAESRVESPPASSAAGSAP